MGMHQEIYLIIIGAAIGFISSVGTTIVAELVKTHGQVKLYYKIVYSKVGNRSTWGFHQTSGGLFFEVPVWIEVQNTSNTVRLIRDINILLFNNGKELTQMIQINKTQDEWYGNEGAYSFILEPRSLRKYDCHFSINKNQMGEDSQFDEIRLRYFDEKNKTHIFLLEAIEHCWKIGDLYREGKWQLAKK